MCLCAFVCERECVLAYICVCVIIPIHQREKIEINKEHPQRASKRAGHEQRRPRQQLRFYE